MKDLLEFLIKNITGSDKFQITQEEAEGKTSFDIKADPSVIGLVIGKGGKTIKNIRKIASIKAVLEKKIIQISVSEA